MRIWAGLWVSGMSKSSSNNRELKNLVGSVEYDVRDGQLTNAEVFLLTTLSLIAPTMEAY